MLSRALNGNAGLAGWNLVMLAPDGGLPSLRQHHEIPARQAGIAVQRPA
jgi:hypothetical protein